MNVLGLLLLFVIAIAAVMGLFYIGSHVATSPAVDTYGNATSTTVNASQSLMGNVSATGMQVGGGVIILIGVVIAAVIFIAFLLIVASRKQYR